MRNNGQFRDRAAFERCEETLDDLGAATRIWEVFANPRVDLRETPGKEAILGGRLEAKKTATLRFLAPSLALSATGKDRVRCRGQIWNIRSAPVQADPHGRVFEFLLETGGAGT